MTDDQWLEELKNCVDMADRMSLASRTDNINLLEILITHDIENDVIRAALGNVNCPDKLRLIGNSRLRTMVASCSTSEKSTICPIPWNHIVIQQNGNLRACCQQIYGSFGVLKENGVALNILTANISEARNSTLMKELRLSMLNNEKHPLCNLCWKEEESGLSSKRTHSLLKYDTSAFAGQTAPDGTIDTTVFPLRYVDIRLGNLCNLKCRYCGPSDSSLWYEDYVALSKDSSFGFYNSNTYNIEKKNNVWQIDSQDFKWYESDHFWNQIEKLMPFIDRYYFTGGEPTINKPHYRLLDLLVEKGYSKQVTLEYNSNMVAIPNSLYSTWAEFKHVDIGCSIDGINEMADYLRPPSEWDRLEKNLDYLGYDAVGSIRGFISSTVSIYNMLHMLDISRWLLEKNYKRISRIANYHVLEWPGCMSIQVLPTSDKEYVTQQYNEFFLEVELKYGKASADQYRGHFSGLLSYMHSKDKSNLIPELRTKTSSLDTLRNHSLLKVNPWLHNILHSSK